MPTPPVKVTIGDKTMTQAEWSRRTGLEIHTFRMRVRVCKNEGFDLQKVLDHDFWRKRKAHGTGKKPPRDRWKYFDTKYGLLNYKEMAEKTGKSVSCMKTRMKLVRAGKIDIDTVFDNKYFEKSLRKGRKKGSGTPAGYGKHSTVKYKKAINIKIEKTLAQIPEPSYLERQMEERGWL